LLLAAREPPVSGQVVPVVWIWKSGVTMTFSGAGLLLVLVIVIACAALVVPMPCDAKVSLAGDMVSGAVEVPFKFTTRGVLMSLPSPQGTAIDPLMLPTNPG
jgi:hypothetical protein